MSDTQTITHRPNPLAAPLLETISTAHARAEELYELRAQLNATREALQVAVAMLTRHDTQVDRLRKQNIWYRAQLRAALSGRTIAEERPEAEAEAVAEWTKQAAA